ncbi:MAG: helix-turn-helix transcriptional regulator [Clostridia bacterium]|nr:helix-turn-helix transcriptional regulator [Clostridia bacterium]
MKLIANNYEAKDIFRIIREWSGLTQKDFAKEIKKSTRSVQDYEAGITKYSINMLLDIAKKHNLKITIEKI